MSDEGQVDYEDLTGMQLSDAELSELDTEIESEKRRRFIRG